MSKALGRPEFKTNPSIGGLLEGCVETGSLAVLSRAREQAVFRDFRPSLLGKVNTVVQILGVLTVMTCEVAPRAGLEDLRMVLLWAIAVLAPVSAAEYAWIVVKRMQGVPQTATPR